MTFIDLFCGMGTIRMGFEQAGHECVYSVEFDKHKRKIYEVIFENEPEGSDIRTVRGTDIPISGCWCFGAPCQDFSIAGQRAGLDGDRSSLVREVFRLLWEIEEEYRPEWLLYENVKGMLSSNKGLDYLEILAEMGSLGYDIEWQLLNSKDFGVPQNRERVYTIGHLRGRGERKIFPFGESNGIFEPGRSQGTLASQHCSSAITKDYSKGVHSGGETYIKTIGKVNSSQDGFILSSDGISKTLTSGHFNVPKIVEPCAVEGVNRGHKDQNGRRFKEPGEPMFTLTKQDIHGVAISYDLKATANSTRRGTTKVERIGALDTQCNVGVTAGTRIRRLTPRECMRLQGVPDYITDKLIAAGISDTQLYRAAGDACTVNVIYEIAKRL